MWVDQNVADVNTKCVRLRIWLPILRLVANYMMGNGDLPILRLGGFHIWLLQIHADLPETAIMKSAQNV